MEKRRTKRAAAKMPVRRKTVCIICGKEKQGVPVKEDNVIRAIRWFKTNVTKNEQNNNLVVCKEDYQKYRKERNKFTSRQLLYVGLGVLFVIGGLFLDLSIPSFAITLLLLIVMYLLSLLNYMPDIMVGKDAEKKQTAANS